MRKLTSGLKLEKKGKMKSEEFKIGKKRNKTLVLLIFHFSLFIFHLTNAQQLNLYIKEALSNHPKIQKVELEYHIAKEKENEVNAFPNAQIGIGYFISEPETRTGAQKFKVSLKQMLPWFGAITARKNYSTALADVQYEDIALVKRKLTAAVASAYYRLFAIRAKQTKLTENIALLRTYETLALTSVEAGKASAVDVLRLQVRKNELEQLKWELEQEYLAEQTLFNKLLNRDSGKAVEVLIDIELPPEDSIIPLENLKLHPELIKYDKLHKSIEHLEALNQKEKRPQLGLGVDYIAVSERPNMNFTDNGKDILMPMLSLSIPVFTKKYHSTSKQNVLKQKKITSEKQDRLNHLETLLDKAVKKRNSARINYDTQLKNLKQAKNAEEILIKTYETGAIDFIDILDIQELQLKFETRQIEAVKDYYLQKTIINYLIDSGL